MKKLLSVAVVALSVTFAGSAFAQTAPLSAQLQQQVDAAIAQDNTAQLTQLAASNPQAAVTIAERVATAAQAAVSTNPAAAASLAAVATTIVTQPAVISALSSNSAAASAVAKVTQTATSVATNSAVTTAAASTPAVAAALSTVKSNAQTVTSNPAVQAAAPTIVQSINSNVTSIQGGPNPPVVPQGPINNTPPVNVDQQPVSGSGL